MILFLFAFCCKIVLAITILFRVKGNCQTMMALLGRPQGQTKFLFIGEKMATKLFQVSQSVKKEFAAAGITARGGRTIFGHLDNNGIQGQLDKLILAIPPTMGERAFLLNLSGNEQAGKCTASAQEAAKTHATRTMTSVTLRGNDATHQILRVANKLRAISGNGPDKYIKQVENYFISTYGHESLAVCRRVAAIIDTVFDDVRETARTMEKEYQACGGYRSHAIDTSEIQVEVLDLKKKTAILRKKQQEIELAYAEREQIA